MKQASIKVDVKDEGGIGTLFDDPEIGSGFCDLTQEQLCDEEKEVYVDLYFEKKIAGKLLLKVALKEETGSVFKSAEEKV